MTSTDSKRLKAAAKARRKAARTGRRRGRVTGVNQLTPREFQLWKEGRLG